MINKSKSREKSLVWWEPVMQGREKEYLGEVIDANFPNEGEFTYSLEKQVAKICGAKYGVGVTSGTMAIFLGLAANGVGKGDEVIVPNVTFIATANAVTLTGATVVLADVKIEDFNIDPASVEEQITEKTKAIVPVHISGRGADMTTLIDIGRKHNLYIVEDAAEALGSMQNGKSLGALGAAGCFSFSPNKTITTGQGGMVVVNDDEIHVRLRELKDQGRPVRGTGGADTHVSLGYNFKLSNLQSAMGLAQLHDFTERLEHQRDLYRHYKKYFGEYSIDGRKVRLIEFDIDGGEAPQWVDVYCDNRDELHDYLLENNIHCRKYWYPLSDQPPYAEDGSQYPRSMKASYNGLWLPSSLLLKEEDVRRVVAEISNWAKKT